MLVTSAFSGGSGYRESIWEIKKHIGYVSPEMHRAYLKNLPAIEIVASGFMTASGFTNVPSRNKWPSASGGWIYLVLRN